jgi:hypothetical protein
MHLKKSEMNSENVGYIYIYENDNQVPIVGWVYNVNGNITKITKLQSSWICTNFFLETRNM